MKSHIISITGIIFLLLFMGCKQKAKETLISTQIDSVVVADIETQPVTALATDDAADDPAIWIHPTDPANSIMIATNKKAGISTYNLEGDELQFYPVGNGNNIDVRYGFQLGNGEKVDIAACSERINNKILVFRINKQDGTLLDVVGDRLMSDIPEVYGFCLYHSPKTGTFYAFMNGKSGIIEQWELTAYGEDEISGTVVRTLNVASQPEGMVADDELGYLYVGEEDRGIWKFMAEPGLSDEPEFISESDTSNKKIAYDIEGLAIYYTSGNKGYLIASSQGNNSFAIFDRGEGNKYIGSFSIQDNGIDGVEETDGIDVTNLKMGAFSNGFFVVQDGLNMTGGSVQAQNFKFVRWEKIANLFEPPLLIDNTYNDENK